MVSILNKFRSLFDGNTAPKRARERDESAGQGMRDGSSREPAPKRLRHSIINENEGSLMSAFSSHICKILDYRPPTLGTRNSNLGSLFIPDFPDISVVGGVENMSNSRSPLLPRPRASKNNSDDIQFLQSSPGLKKSTPYVKTSKLKTLRASTHTPVFTIDDDDQNRHENGGSATNNGMRPSTSRALRVGGNDGLVDEVDDGFEDEEVMDTATIPTQKSPVYSSFRFNPSLTSTAERKSAASRQTNKWHSKRTESVIPTSFGPVSGMPRLSKSVYLSSRPPSCMPAKNRFKARFGMFGLSKKYQSTAKECYRMMDKEAYMELLRQSSSDSASNSVSRSNSVYSFSSVVPLNKTQLNVEYSKQKLQELESKRRQEQMKKNVSSDIALWSRDKKVEEITDPVKGYASNQRSASSVTESSGARPKEKSSGTIEIQDDDDDDLIITKETIKKVAKPNSLEQHARFSAFYKFTPQWMDELEKRRVEKSAGLERHIQESELTMKLASERRKKAATIEDSVTRRFKLLDMRHPAPVIEISDEDVLVELTPDMEKVINAALRKHPPNEVLTEKFNIQITRKDIWTLSGLNWLNDEVINFYMNMLMERGKNDNYPSVYAFSTFFYPKLLKTGFSGVKRWTKKVDIFSHELVLVPVHLGMHWCLATINVKDKVITYYDSMLGDNKECLLELKKYLQDEHVDKKKTSIDLSDWKCETPKDIPQQMNGSDCGMFACKFSEYLSRRRPITFTQDHMPYFRRRMVYEIITNKLL